MFAAVMIRFNLGGTFCAHAVEVVEGVCRGKYLPSFHSTIVPRGLDVCAPQCMQMNRGSCQSLDQMILCDVWSVKCSVLRTHLFQ